MVEHTEHQFDVLNQEGIFIDSKAPSWCSAVPGAELVLGAPSPVMEDFYCEEALSGRTPIRKVMETDAVLAFHHTRPYWPVHIVVIPKRHISSLLTLEESDNDLLLELFRIIKQIAAQVVQEHGAARILTNLGQYQDSKHLHFHINSGAPLR